MILNSSHLDVYNKQAIKKSTMFYDERLESYKVLTIRNILYETYKF